MAISKPNLVKIPEIAAELWTFFFQNGGRPPSWILLQVKSDVTARRGKHAKFGDNISNNGRVIAIFRFSIWRPAAILDFVVAQK